jgi:oligoendopeptidase F
VPLETEEEKLAQEYFKTTGAMSVEYEGKEQTLMQMEKYLEKSDRRIRQEVWEKVFARRLKVKDPSMIY